MAKTCKERNSKIRSIVGDSEFDSSKHVSQEEKCNVECNPTAAHEHVAEVEHIICAVKDCICATHNEMSWKVALS